MPPSRRRWSSPGRPPRRGPDRRSRQGRCLDARRRLGRVLGAVGRDTFLVIALPHRDELVHGVEVVDVELAVEVVELVLECAAQQPRARDLDLAPAAILRRDPDLLLPGDVRRVPGNGEATLEIAVLARRSDDPRVHELMDAVVDLDDAGVERLADLRRRETDTRRVAHRRGQVVEEAVQELVEARDGLALEAKPRVTEQDDRADAHAPEYRVEAASSLAASLAPRAPS